MPVSNFAANYQRAISIALHLLSPELGCPNTRPSVVCCSVFTGRVCNLRASSSSSLFACPSRSQIFLYNLGRALHTFSLLSHAADCIYLPTLSTLATLGVDHTKMPNKICWTRLKTIERSRLICNHSSADFCSRLSKASNNYPSTYTLCCRLV